MLRAIERKWWMLPAVAALATAGCAITIENAPRNRPALAESARAPDAPSPPNDLVEESAIAMSFSGGGLRAAAFSFGVLQALDETVTQGNRTLLDDVTFITSVSGGSMTAAYYGLHGKAALANFREEGLLRDGEADLRFSLLNPVNLARVLSGGLNDRRSFQQWLEKDLFKGATFADLFRHRKPEVWINATNVYQRVAFPFNQRVFDALCSDLASYPVSEAVAASMAVPVFFAPVVLQKFPDHCQTVLPYMVLEATTTTDSRSLLSRALARAINDFRDTRNGHYVKLVDGGVTDNLGLSSVMQARLALGTPYAPLTENDALRVRDMLFVVVDAGQGPSGAWNHDVAGPSGIELATAAIDSAMEANVRMSYDGFLQMLQRWQRDLARYRCELPEARIADIRRTRPHWRCDDVNFSATYISFADLGLARESELAAIPTRLKLPTATVDNIIAAGRESLLMNRTVQAFRDKLRANSTP
jgi:NTE family protein